MMKNYFELCRKWICWKMGNFNKKHTTMIAFQWIDRLPLNFCNELIVYPSIHDFHWKFFNLKSSNWKFQRLTFFSFMPELAQKYRPYSKSSVNKNEKWSLDLDIVFSTCFDPKWILGVGNRWKCFVIKTHLKKSRFWYFI